MVDKIEISQSRVQSFQVLREHNDFFDVTLVTDDEERVEAHKAVLSAFSPFFKNIFENCNVNQQPFVYLSGISSNQIHGLLDYIYQGTVHILADEVESFLKVATKLKISELCNGIGMRKPLVHPHNNEFLANSSEINIYNEALEKPPPIMGIQIEKGARKYNDHKEKLDFTCIDISSFVEPTPKSDRNQPIRPFTIYEKPRPFSFVEGGEEYVLSKEAAAYYSQHHRCHPNYFYIKFKGLKRRNLTKEEKKKLVSMGFSEKFESSTLCYVFLKKEFDDVFEGRHIDNYTKPVSLQLPTEKIFCTGRKYK